MSPTASYRLQLHAGFPIAAARDLVDYLARLGVSHLYSAPLLRARRGSTHGYDVVDPTVLNPELGTEADLGELAASLHRHGMGLLLDIVPNHMAASDQNPFWEDVLAHGPSSPFAPWFDIDWGPDGTAPVVVPVLGDLAARVLARGEFGLISAGGALRLRYFEHTFPIDPASIPRILAGGEALDHPELQAILDRLSALPPPATRDPARCQRAAEALRDIAALAEASPAVGRILATAATAFGEGTLGKTRLRALMDAQPYRLVSWRQATSDINYRRFFNVSDLIGVRVEDRAVFDATHARIADWVARRWVDLLRVDHVDGLWEPRAYLERVRSLADVPIYVEKILTGTERLREDWPVAGTTGYEFLNALEAIFIDPEGFAAVEAWYRRLLRAPAAAGFPSAARAGKRRLLDTWLAPDVRRLGRQLRELVRGDPRAAALGIRELTAAIVELIVCFPVYRTYVDGRVPSPVPADRLVVEDALRGARRAALPTAAFELLADVILAEVPPTDRSARRSFVQRLQQTTPPAMAKGVEDTALYRWVPLVALNEVGGDPGAPLAPAAEALHAANAERARRWPASLLCTSTHDTKRSADVRARLDVLSEIPGRWTARVAHWRHLNAGHRRQLGARFAPDPSTEYLLYQTLVGVWPLAPADEGLGELGARVRTYLRKAVREAKVHSSWLDPDPAYEEAVDAFVQAALASDAFVADLAAFAGEIARAGLWTALARTLVHLTAPGVPDLYQGDELWRFALTDPDNRRPVDFAGRRALLAALDARPVDEALTRELLDRSEDGRIKLHVVRTALRLRRAAPELFAGGYEPVAAEGPAARHVFAFVRRGAGRAAVTVVPRLVLSLTSGAAAPLGAAIWRDTQLRLDPDLDGKPLTNALTGVRRPVSAVASALETFPVALLLSDA